MTMPAESPYPLPTFIVVGANKGGTTSLFHYLQQHPEVYLESAQGTSLLSKDIDPEQFSKGFAHNKLRDIAAYVSGPMTDHKHAGFVRSWDHYCKAVQVRQWCQSHRRTEYLLPVFFGSSQRSREALGDIHHHLPAQSHQPGLFSLSHEPVDRQQQGKDLHAGASRRPDP